jgi:hypothetical protein
MEGESHHKRELNKDPLQPYPRSTGLPRAEVLLGIRAEAWPSPCEGAQWPDLPPPLPVMGTGGQTEKDLARSGQGGACPRTTGTGGGLYRRLLHGGEKGGRRKIVIIGESEDFRAFATLGRPDRKARRKLLWHGVPRLHADLIQMFIMRCSRFCQLGRPY